MILNLIDLSSEFSSIGGGRAGGGVCGLDDGSDGGGEDRPLRRQIGYSNEEEWGRARKLGLGLVAAVDVGHSSGGGDSNGDVAGGGGR